MKNLSSSSALEKKRGLFIHLIVRFQLDSRLQVDLFSAIDIYFLNSPYSFDNFGYT